MNTYSRDGLSLYCLGRASFLRWPSHTQTIYSPSGGGHKLLHKVTMGYKEYLQQCNPDMIFPIPNRVLTHPYDGINNDGYDNTNHDLILRQHDVLYNARKQIEYIIDDLLGKGTFGQVVKCHIKSTKQQFAIKIIKNQAAYNQQSKTEINVLRTLQEQILVQQYNCDNIIQLKDQFIHKKHVCLVFPLMACSLLDILRHNHYEGLRVKLVRKLLQQLVNGMVVAEACGVVHADLKPENVMMEQGNQQLEESTLKIIDFGSSCFMNSKPPYIYIQSRFYRAPEIIMRHKDYTNKIDIWSLGCIAVELLCGTPLFPCAEEYSCLERILSVTKEKLTPDGFINESNRVDEFFQYDQKSNCFVLKSPDQYMIETDTQIKGCYNKNHPISSLSDMKRYYEEQLDDDKGICRLYLGMPEFRHFLDFVQKCLRWNPKDRINAENAGQHVFLNDEKVAEFDIDFLLEQLDTQNESNQSSSSINEDQFDY